MASFYAELEVAGHTYPVRMCKFDFTQATDARGRLSGKVRYGLVHLSLDVPHDNFLLNWGVTINKPLAGHVTFFETNQRTARETMSFTAGECVGYHETFDVGDSGAGAYVCHLTIAVQKLVLNAGGPLRPAAAPVTRNYPYLGPVLLTADSGPLKKMPELWDNLKLGPNEEYRDAIIKASTLTKIDAAAIACVISAEALPDRNGKWDPISKPRLKEDGKPASTALGLTQFIEDTWLKMATTPDSFLNKQAKELQLVDEKNKIVPGAKEKLLKLRENPTTSIITAAEYGQSNLKKLEEAGIKIPDDPTERARYMYIAHHEGLKGAKAYFTDSMEEARAKKNLIVNRGGGEKGAIAAAADIEKYGDAKNAYKNFLENYSKDRIKPDKFRNPKVDSFPDRTKNMA